MLSIGAMKCGQAEYYLSLAREDYYLEGGEPEGKWIGNGAEALSLGDTVVANDLRNLFQGFSRTSSKLVQNAGKHNRQPGWDLTFSAPKSVSVLWSQSDCHEQAAIQAAHANAVRAAIQYLEANFAQSRVGKGGSELVDVGLVVAAFEHSCSRALDPQLHTHALVLNLGVDATGKTRSLVSKPLYQAKMLAGAYYRSELAYQLRYNLGLKTFRPKNKRGQKQSWFELAGVSEAVMLRFSKRRQEILKELGSVGLDTASAAAFAALSTRKAKDVVPPRNELKEAWKKEGQSYGFRLQEVERTSEVSESDYMKLYRESLAQAVATITFSENFFTKAELTRRTLEAAQEFGLPAKLIAKQVSQDLVNHPIFVSLGTREGDDFWTTKDVLELEKEFLKAAKSIHEREFGGIKSTIVSKVLAKPRGNSPNTYLLDEEQKQAVRYIAEGKDSFKVVTGFAGTGKTDMLAAAREALEQGGYTVIGTSLAGVAARELQEKAGIQSDTVRMRELQLQNGAKHSLKHHARQLGRAALGKKTFKQQKLVIDSKTVLVIDEAGMVGTRDFSMLCSAVNKQGGSIVAVGDQWQLPSIERGGCLGTLAHLIDGVHLTEIRRQQDAADRQAVKDIMQADAESFLKHYAKKGQLVITKSHERTEAALISEWKTAGGVQEPLAHRIYAATHAEVDRYNALAQWERAIAGLADPLSGVEHDERRFMVGDEVIFTSTNKSLRIRKADQGTVVAARDGFTGKFLVVKINADEKEQTRPLDTLKHHATQLIRSALGKSTERLTKRKDLVLVPLKTLNPLQDTYSDLRLNYCQTVHAAQGQSVKNVYVHLGGRMTNRELSYVQGSRHKKMLMLFAEEREAGKGLTELARAHSKNTYVTDTCKLPQYSSLIKSMRFSKTKVLAHEITSRQVELLK